MADPIPGVSDSIREKAHRYLTSGKVQVAEVVAGTALRATVLVSGSGSDPYRVLVTGRAVHCSCPARVWACAHVVAALLVLEVTEPEQPATFGDDDTITALIDGPVTGDIIEHSVEEGPLTIEELDAFFST